MPCYWPVQVDVELKAVGSAPRRQELVTVPCGKCLGCVTDRARQWAIRTTHESALHPATWFATLTYRPEDVPETGSLVREDLVRFLKRFRKQEGELRYFACGEYGGRTYRPHYHAIFMGPRFLDREKVTERSGSPVFRAPSLEERWGLGSCEITPVTWAAISYVTGYMVKRERRLARNPGELFYADAERERYTRVNPLTGELVQVEEEFSSKSRRPALGRRWLERYWSDVYPKDFVVMDGAPMKPPRYYDRWMDAHQPEVMEQVRFQRYQDAEEIGDEKLIMKEKVHRARAELYNKRNGI